MVLNRPALSAQHATEPPVNLFPLLLGLREREKRTETQSVMWRIYAANPI